MVGQVPLGWLDAAVLDGVRVDLAADELLHYVQHARVCEQAKRLWAEVDGRLLRDPFER